jgi:hypothetical protein
MKPIKISLTQEDFENLVAGKEVERKDKNVKIILQDIGWLNMISIISNIFNESEFKEL